MDDLKLPPHSIDAEQSIIGGLLLSNDAWVNVSDIINADDFYRHDHRLIYICIKELIDTNEPCDVVTLSEVLAAKKQLEEVGGFSFLGNLVNNTPGISNIQAYAKIVREHSILRQLIKVTTEIYNDSFNPEGKKSSEILEVAEQKVFKIADKGAASQGGFHNMKDLLKKSVDRIDKLYHDGTAFTGIPTSFTNFDKLTSGLQPADLIIVAARPSMGKTSFAMNIAENVAIGEGKGVAVFSMEMPAESLTLRLLSSLGRINQTKVRSGQLDDDDWSKLTSATSTLNTAKIHIDDTAALSPSDIKSRVRRLLREQEVDLIIIDYLQLMQIPGRGDNRVNEISEISRGLKALAKEINVPVIALSQLNRSLEQRPNKRPVMSDLRESGAIEQDADVIVFIYRDEVYNEDTEHKGIAEIIISKQRNGPLGTSKLTFIGEYTRFENHASSEYGDIN